MLFKVKVQLKTVGAFICSKDFYISPPPPPPGWLWTKLYIMILTKPESNKMNINAGIF